MIAIIGDVHGHYDEVFAKMASIDAQIDFWLQVGDLGGEDMSYPDFPVPCYFIQGNHENWDVIDDMKTGKLPKNLHFIPNGSTVKINNLKILGLGGNYSPRYSTQKRVDIPSIRRRHYNCEEVDKATQNANIDIFITHEAPSPYFRRGRDIGQTTISSIIQSVRPKIHFFGHHHHYFEGTYYDIRSYCLEYGTISCVLYDPISESTQKIKF